ncbi:myeloid leukemia factor 1 isoform X1 [Lepisosteus oculatus]|uniref:myeloid leukemia factor 1 isoform X1 n=2 Tax=Lepisosteus oculatus TaxID=7918 RepID=UPI0035F525BF
MFNSTLREFEEDPFFADPFRAHNEHVRQMMRSFSEPFGRDPFLSIADGTTGNQRGNLNASMALREGHRGMSQSLMPFGSFSSTASDARNPFSMMDSMMSSMRNRVVEMHRNFENLSNDSNVHSFSSSSVMTYSKVGDEPAKVFQATNQTRRAPGGIKETRQSLKDSESGLEKMAIGHHIRDRAHVIEQKQNRKTGEREMNQDFLNLDESEAQSFDDEWQREVSKFKPSVPLSRLEAPKQRTVHRAAIASKADEGRREKHRPKGPAEVKNARLEDLNIKGSRVIKH